MEELLYKMIFKRKSFHIFKDIGVISEMELQDIQIQFECLKPLIPEIRVAMQIVSSNETTCKRGQEYCILLYSEVKDNYLQNIGYLGEQLDLYLASKNIGALWFGIGKVEEKQCNDLEFVIMLAIAKMPEDKFRKDMFKSKRKPLEEIWNGAVRCEIGNIARFAPSACNTQPWIVESSKECLRIFRYKKPGKRGIMPADKVAYYNRIDIGIFLQFIELCLANENTEYERIVFADEIDLEKTLVAEYWLK